MPACAPTAVRTYLQQGLTVRAALEQEWVNNTGGGRRCSACQGRQATWRFWEKLMRRD